MRTESSYEEYTKEIAKLGAISTLTEDDIQSLRTQRLKVFSLMKDGRWHTATEILKAAAGTEGLRRMRELRQLPGVTIDCQRSSAPSRVFLYRMRYEKPIN